MHTFDTPEIGLCVCKVAKVAKLTNTPLLVRVHFLNTPPITFSEYSASPDVIQTALPARLESLTLFVTSPLRFAPRFGVRR